jgi:hypothetical protein
MPTTTQARNTTFSVPPLSAKAPRRPAEANPQPGPQLINMSGYGRRSLWAYPPIGEAAQRDPHVPDPTPGLERKPLSQADADPPVQTTRYQDRHFAVGGGMQYNGLPASISYIKRIGTLLTRSLSRNLLSGIVEARWRVGGVTYPLDYGYGPGYVGDAQTLWLDNPQAYLRNPGIIPLTNAPATYRIAPNMPTGSYYGWLIQPVGPLIGDVGTTVPIGSRVA